MWLIKVCVALQGRFFDLAFSICCILCLIVAHTKRDEREEVRLKPCLAKTQSNMVLERVTLAISFQKAG